MHAAPGYSTHPRSGGATSPTRSRRRLAFGPGLAGPSGSRPRAEARSLHVYLASILGGIALAAAWLLPETVASAILSWVAASLLVFALRSRRAHLPIYCGGLVGHAL